MQSLLLIRSNPQFNRTTNNRLLVENQQNILNLELLLNLRH